MSPFFIFLYVLFAFHEFITNVTFKKGGKYVDLISDTHPPTQACHLVSYHTTLWQLFNISVLPTPIVLFSRRTMCCAYSMSMTVFN